MTSQKIDIFILLASKLAKIVKSDRFCLPLPRTHACTHADTHASVRGPCVVRPWSVRGLPAIWVASPVLRQGAGLSVFRMGCPERLIEICEADVCRHSQLAPGIVKKSVGGVSQIVFAGCWLIYFFYRFSMLLHSFSIERDTLSLDFQELSADVHRFPIDFHRFLLRFSLISLRCSFIFPEDIHWFV